MSASHIVINQLSLTSSVLTETKSILCSLVQSRLYQLSLLISAYSFMQLSFSHILSYSLLRRGVFKSSNITKQTLHRCGGGNCCIIVQKHSLYSIVLVQ